MARLAVATKGPVMTHDSLGLGPVSTSIKG